MPVRTISISSRSATTPFKRRCFQNTTSSTFPFSASSVPISSPQSLCLHYSSAVDLFPPSKSNPTSLKSALLLSESKDCARMHDSCIDMNIKLGAWKPVLISDINNSNIPFWRYRYKNRSDGSPDKNSAQCTVRGDLMVPNVHFYSSKTSDQNPSYAAKRLFYAHAALTGDIVEVRRPWRIPSR